MAMLAGPRRKQKVINLRAKNNAWSNDTNKYGLRILAGMGWTMGKGLGLKENGIVEHVVARYKDDETGLGFEDRNDQWTKHEDDFNALLANLSNGDSNNDSNDEKLHSGVSLEDKSKKSNKRVHYHKFTRGKDLTRYSEKDLANIFGKKTLKNDKNPKPEDNEEASENNAISNTSVVFTEKGSMEDYFKSKMAAIKSRAQLNKPTNDSSYGDSVDYSFKGFSGEACDEEEEERNQGLGFQPFSSKNTEDNNEGGNENSVFESDGMSIKTKKKNKKQKHSAHSVDNSFQGFSGEARDKEEEESHRGLGFQPFCTENTEDYNEGGNENDVFESEEMSIKTKKKSNKQKHSSHSVDNSFQGFSGEACDKEEEESHRGLGFQPFSSKNTEDNTEGGNENDVFESEEMSIKTKKKNKKQKHSSHSVDNSFQGFSGEARDEEEEESHGGLGYQPFSFKNTEDNTEGGNENAVESEGMSIRTKKKNKQKKKQKQNQEEITQEIADDTENVNTQIDEPEKPKKSKKKKQKDLEESFEESLNSENVETKKSKKKKNVKIDEDVVEDYVPKKKKKSKMNKNINE